MSYKLTAVLGAALLSTVAIAQDVQSQAIIPQDTAATASFNNEVRVEGIGFSLSELTEKGKIAGVSAERTTTTSKIVTLPAVINAKFGFGDFAVRPTLNLGQEKNAATLAFGYNLGVVEAGVGASLESETTKVKVEKVPGETKVEKHGNTLFAYGIVKPQIDNGVSLEVEGRAGFRSQGQKPNGDARATLTGFTGGLEARVFFDVTPQLALGVSGGLDYTNLSGKSYESSILVNDAKTSKILWKANIANVRYSF